MASFPLATSSLEIPAQSMAYPLGKVLAATSLIVAMASPLL